MSSGDATIPRKRGRKPTTAAASEAVEPISEAAPPQLTTRELYELRLAEAEFRASQNLAEAARLKRLYVLAILDPKGRVAAAEKERESALASVGEAKKRYEQIKSTAFARLGLKASAVTGFDADTGVIHFPDSARG